MNQFADIHNTSSILGVIFSFGSILLKSKSLFLLRTIESFIFEKKL